MDKIKEAVSKSRPHYRDWYSRRYDWIEVIGYNPNDRYQNGITVMMAFSIEDFPIALKMARRLTNDYSDSWRIVRHTDKPVIIAQRLKHDITGGDLSS
jgi:hypothetical protein